MIAVLLQGYNLRAFEMQTKEECLYVARLAEQTDNFDQMLENMKRVVGMGSELDANERNLLSVAYKNCIAPRRQALKTLKCIQKRE